MVTTVSIKYCLPIKELAQQQLLVAIQYNTI